MSSLIDRNEPLSAATEPPPPLPTTNKLLSDITDDAGTLLTQHWSLFKSEMREGLGQAKWCLVAAFFGFVAICLGGLSLMLGLVYLIPYLFPTLPGWASWLIAGGVLFLLGGLTISLSIRFILRASLVPTRTLRTLSESWQWLVTRQK